MIVDLSKLDKVCREIHDIMVREKLTPSDVICACNHLSNLALYGLIEDWQAADRKKNESETSEQ